jgi:hypothetical protein
MRKISRRLLLSSLTVLLTVIALGTTTFAWFTITNTARISSFETQIAAEEGIEIAIGIINPSLADGDETKFEVNSPANLNWVTTLTAADVEEYIQTHIESGFRFEHLTSSDGRTFNTFTSDAVGGTVLNGYVKLPIHFRSGDVYTINWTAVSLSGGTPLPTWVSDVDSFTNVNGNTINRGDTITVDPSNAMRISFDDGSNVVAYEKPFAGSNLVLGTGGDLSAEVDPDGTPSNGDEYIPQNVGAHSYYFAKTNLYPDGITSVNTIATTTNLTESSVDGVSVLTLDAGQQATAGMEYYAQGDIYIWIEGWDPNAFNAILDEYVFISFTFKGMDA